MARIGIHHDAHTAPDRAAGRLRRFLLKHPNVAYTLRVLSYYERTAERHWPFAAYAVLTIATAAYVAAQLARL